MTFDMTPPFERIPTVRHSYNVGSLLDVPTGSYVKGKHGESILNGGVGACTGIVGIGNQFKSTIMHGLVGACLSRYADSNAMTYDTEINLSEDRIMYMTAHLEGFSLENNPITMGRWTISDKTAYFGNEWFDKYKEYVKFKFDNRAKILKDTPFLDRDGKLMQVITPTFTELDSLSEFETEDVAEMKDANSLGEKGANTIYMRQGLSKTRMLSEMSKTIAVGGTPMFMSAHIGKLIGMDPHAPPVQKLKYLKNGDTIKGVTDKFNFLTTILWQCQNTTPMVNEGTKASEYPADSSDNMRLDTDLNLVTLLLLRNKYGPSGMMMQVIVSQEQGILPSLSEFHYIKTCERFGLEGNLQNYTTVFCPDIKLSRTTIRTKIDKHPELRRTLNILAELCQMTQLWTDDEKVFCTPKELYDDLKAIGYNWDVLLKTRGWWTFSNDDHPVQFCSTMDLLRMRKGLYTPHWWDHKTYPLDQTKVKA